MIQQTTEKKCSTLPVMKYHEIFTWIKLLLLLLLPSMMAFKCGHQNNSVALKIYGCNRFIDHRQLSIQFHRL